MIGYFNDKDVKDITLNCENIFNSEECTGDFKFCELVQKNASCDVCYYKIIMKEECPFLDSTPLTIHQKRAVAWKMWELMKRGARVMILNAATLEAIEPTFHVYLHDYPGCKNGFYEVMSKDEDILILKSPNEKNYYSVRVVYNPYCFFHTEPGISSTIVQFNGKIVSRGEFLFLATNPRVKSGFYEVIKKTYKSITIDINGRPYVFTIDGCFAGEFEQYLFFSQKQAELGNFIKVVGDNRRIFRNVFIHQDRGEIAFGKRSDMTKEISKETYLDYTLFGIAVFCGGKMDFIKAR